MDRDKNNINTRHRGGRGLLSSIASAPKHILNTARDIADLPRTLTGAVINKAIDLIPVELNIPSYQYCGPGGRLEERLRRGDPGINPLDAACKDHDIAYHNFKDSANRAEADRLLADRAWERVKSSDASLGEKAAAWTVANIMKLKSKLGGRLKRKPKRGVKRKIGKGAFLEPYKSKIGCGRCNCKKKKNIAEDVIRILTKQTIIR